MRNNFGRAIKGLLLLFLALTLIFAGVSYAVELVRQKNVATHIVFPIVDADGDAVTGAAGLDSEFTYFDDSTGGVNWVDLTNEATEIQSSGWYDVSMTQSEMNHDYIAVYVKTSTTGAKGQAVLIRTTAGAPSAVATTTTAGNTIDVASTGEVGLDFNNIKDASGAHTLTNITVPVVTEVTNAVVLPTGTGAGQIALSSGAVTVGTNNDKTGYTASTVSDKTGYSLAADQAVNVTKIAGSAVSTSTAQLGVNVVNWGGATAPAMTGDAYARLGSPAGASVSADIAAIKSDSGAIKTKTDYLPAATAGSAGGLFIAGSNAATSITTALTANITGNLSGSVGSVTGSVGSVTGNVGGSVASVTGAVGSVTSGVTVTTNNDKTGYALSAAGIDAIWDELQSGHTTSGSFGLYLDAKVSEAGSGGLTAASIADAVWDEAISGHLTAGTTGSKLNSAAAAGDPWSTEIPGSYTGSQAGYYLPDLIKKSRGR